MGELFTLIYSGNFAELPGTLDLIYSIVIFVLIIGAVWLVIKTLFKVAMRVFWTGCFMILCLGLFLAAAAFLTVGG